MIPTELNNPEGLRKLKELYRTELQRLNGDENAPSIQKLRTDIQLIEREVGTAFAVSASRK